MRRRDRQRERRLWVREARRHFLRWAPRWQRDCLSPAARCLCGCMQPCRWPRAWPFLSPGADEQVDCDAATVQYMYCRGPVGVSFLCDRLSVQPRRVGWRLSGERTKTRRTARPSARPARGAASVPAVAPVPGGGRAPAPPVSQQQRSSCEAWGLAAGHVPRRLSCKRKTRRPACAAASARSFVEDASCWLFGGGGAPRPPVPTSSHRPCPPAVTEQAPAPAAGRGSKSRPLTCWLQGTGHAKWMAGAAPPPVRQRKRGWGWWAAPAPHRASAAAAPRPPGEEGVGREWDDGWPGARAGVALRKQRPEGRPATLPTQRAAVAPFLAHGTAAHRPWPAWCASAADSLFSLERSLWRVPRRLHGPWTDVRPRRLGCPRPPPVARGGCREPAATPATGVSTSKTRATAQRHRAVCTTGCSPTGGT